MKYYNAIFFALLLINFGCSELSRDGVGKVNHSNLETEQNTSNPATIKSYFDKIQVGMDRETVRQINGMNGVPKDNNPEHEQTFFYDYDNSYITIVYKVDSKDKTFSVLDKYYKSDNLTIKQRNEKRFEALNEWLRQRREIMERIHETE